MDARKLREVVIFVTFCCFLRGGFLRIGRGLCVFEGVIAGVCRMLLNTMGHYENLILLAFPVFQSWYLVSIFVWSFVLYGCVGSGDGFACCGARAG